MANPQKAVKNLAAEIVRVSIAEVGVEEIDGTNCGEVVNQYKAATNLPPEQPWPWCAAFVCWVVKTALKNIGAKETDTFKRPTTAGAWDFENWSRRQDATTSTLKNQGFDIRPGDIVVFKFSHIGIAVSAPDKEGFIRTVEGNTDSSGSREGGGVFAKRRQVSKIRSRIRFRQEKLITAE